MYYSWDGWVHGLLPTLTILWRLLCYFIINNSSQMHPYFNHLIVQAIWLPYKHFCVCRPCDSIACINNLIMRKVKCGSHLWSHFSLINNYTPSLRKLISYPIWHSSTLCPRPRLDFMLLFFILNFGALTMEWNPVLYDN